jgi:hypothetical protein
LALGFVEPIIAQTYYSLKEYLELFIDQYSICDPSQTDLLSHVDGSVGQTLKQKEQNRGNQHS